MASNRRIKFGRLVVPCITGLLEIDGLDDKWEDGVRSDWVSELGHHNPVDVQRHALPAALARLTTPDALRQYDPTAMGPVANRGPPRVVAQSNEELPPPGDVRITRQLSLHLFRSKLVEHFDILFEQKMVTWPVRNKTYE